MLLQVNRKVISKKMKTMIERLDITKRSPGKSYRREIICKVIEETVKIECTKKEMEPK